MCAKGFRFALLAAVTTWCAAVPTSAYADPEGKSYTTLEFISFYGNWDCYRFEEEGKFVSTYGLIQGEYTTEELCLFSLPIIGCLFSIDTYEVTIEAPSNPVYTALDLSDFLPGVEIIIGSITTDDEDGFFLGFQSPICAYPARCCPIPPPQSPTPIQ